MIQAQIHAAMHKAAGDRRVAEERNPFLESFFSRSISEYFKGKEVLDFWCALGGTALAWEAMYGVKKISGFDVSPYFIEGAQRYAKHMGSTADFRQGFGERTPFSDGAFDTVVAIDVLEHVYKVEDCLTECWRVPFEHHIKVYRMPFMHWFFSGETIRKALNYMLIERGPDYTHFKAEPNSNYRIPDLNGSPAVPHGKPSNSRAGRLFVASSWNPTSGQEGANEDYESAQHLQLRLCQSTHLGGSVPGSSRSSPAEAMTASRISIAESEILSSHSIAPHETRLRLHQLQ